MDYECSCLEHFEIPDDVEEFECPNCGNISLFDHENNIVCRDC